MSYYRTLIQQATGTTFPFTDDFIAATGIVDAGIIGALQTMETDLTAQGWLSYPTSSKFVALYPMVGGTAATHKFNFIDPQDTDAAFRLSNLGAAGWTHDANGAKPVNTFADTHLVPATHLAENDTHVAYYSNSDNAGTAVEIGCRNDSQSARLDLSINYGGGASTCISDHYTFVNQRLTPPDGSNIGLRCATRVSGSDHRVFKAGAQIGVTNAGLNNKHQFLTFPLYLANTNNAGINTPNPSAKRCAFASIGAGFTPAENATLYTIVQNFNTTLGRQV